MSYNDLTEDLKHKILYFYNLKLNFKAGVAKLKNLQLYIIIAKTTQYYVSLVEIVDVVDIKEYSGFRFIIFKLQNIKYREYQIDDKIYLVNFSKLHKYKIYTDEMGRRFIYLFKKQLPTVICSEDIIINKLCKIYISDLQYQKCEDNQW